MTGRPTNDLKTILTVVAMLGAFVSYVISFSSRVTKAEADISYMTQRLDRMEGKLDRLIERSEKP